MSETPIPQNNSNEVRKLLLDFYSSEIESHSNLIIGLAVILFTALEFFPKPQNGTYVWDLQSGIGIFIIWIISGSLWFFLMRHFTYGVLCKAAIEASFAGIIKIDSLSAAVAMRDYAFCSNVLFVFPSPLFLRGSGDVRLCRRAVSSKLAVSLGLALCYLGFGVVTTFLLLLLIGVRF